MLRGGWQGHFDDQIDGAAVAQPQPPLQPEPRLQPQTVPQLQPQTVPQLLRVEQQLGQEQRQRQQRKMPHEGLHDHVLSLSQRGGGVTEVAAEVDGHRFQPSARGSCRRSSPKYGQGRDPWLQYRWMSCSKGSSHCHQSGRLLRQAPAPSSLAQR
jgi:hypothetical protein